MGKYSLPDNWAFENEIENGSVKYGIGTNTEDNIFFDYIIEEILWTDEPAEYKLYCNITITIKNGPDYRDQFDAVLAKNTDY